jgi:hypothetical protein
VNDPHNESVFIKPSRTVLAQQERQLGLLKPFPVNYASCTLPDEEIFDRTFSDGAEEAFYMFLTTAVEICGEVA